MLTVLDLRWAVATLWLILPQHRQPKGADRDRFYCDSHIVRHDLFGPRVQWTFPGGREGLAAGLRAYRGVYGAITAIIMCSSLRRLRLLSAAIDHRAGLGWTTYL